MADVISFQNAVKKKFIEKIASSFGKMYEEASYVADSYFKLMLEDPASAIDQLPAFIDKARNVNPRQLEAIAGGPNYSWTGPLLDILGVVYPSLEKEVRERGLLRCIGFLDRLNYFNAQNNVELINEPWLAADIIVNRPLYWCGYSEYCDLLRKYPKWADFSQNAKSPKSEFFLSLAVTRPEYSSLEVRANFYRNFPDLIDRTEDGIAALTAEEAHHRSLEKGTHVEDFIRECLEGFDPLLHDKILSKIEENKWIKLNC